MKLYCLPYRVSPAAENMARDWLLLDAFPEPDSPRWRAYGWTAPAWTFGYSQNFQSLRREVDNSGGTGAPLIRRATGGGLVDHRADWTYAVALPLSHPLAVAGARHSYSAIHSALAETLIASGVKVILADCPCAPAENESPSTSPSLSPSTTSSPATLTSIRFPILPACFTRAEMNDVIRADSSHKVAGAAQKRSKRGLLFQGSVSRAAAPEISDWEKFATLFSQNLAKLLQADAHPWPGDAAPPAVLAEATAQYSSREWNEQR